VPVVTAYPIWYPPSRRLRLPSVKSSRSALGIAVSARTDWEEKTSSKTSSQEWRAPPPLLVNMWLIESPHCFDSHPGVVAQYSLISGHSFLSHPPTDGAIEQRSHLVGDPQRDALSQSQFICFFFFFHYTNFFSFIIHMCIQGLVHFSPLPPPPPLPPTPVYLLLALRGLSLPMPGGMGANLRRQGLNSWIDRLPVSSMAPVFGSVHLIPSHGHRGGRDK
jgi:hypothetical protein